MKKYLMVTAITLSLLGGTAAHADTLVRDATVGAALGAVVGSSVGGRDAALVGGLLGAAVAVSLSDSNTAPANYNIPQPYYVPAPVFYQPITVPVYYQPVAIPIYYDVPNNLGSHHGRNR